MGNVRYLQERWDEALRYFEEALAQYRKTKTGTIDYDVLASIGQIYNRKGEYELAEKHLQEGLELAKQKNKRRSIIDTYVRLADLKISTRKFGEAQTFLANALREMEKYNRP